MTPAVRPGSSSEASSAGAAWEVRSALRALRRSHPLGDEVCVALSGGADSLALLAATVAEFGAAGAGDDAEAPPVTALIVDHGLQKSSDVIADRAAATGRRLGAAAEVLRVRVDSDGFGPEAQARSARYAALDSARAGRPVLLGHTLDDQAETVLLGLGRGSGARSLRGMTAWRAPWARPLLTVRAETTRAACRELGLEWWDDPHNLDPAFTRVRLRREVLPLLEEVLGGGAALGLARSADLLRDDDDALDAAARTALRDAGAEAADSDDGSHAAGTGPEAAVLGALPAAIRSRALHLWLRSLGVGAPTRALVEAVSALVTDTSGRGEVAIGGAPPAPGEEASGPSRLVVVRRHGKLETTIRGPARRPGRATT